MLNTKRSIAQNLAQLHLAGLYFPPALAELAERAVEKLPVPVRDLAAVAAEAARVLHVSQDLLVMQGAFVLGLDATAQSAREHIRTIHGV